MKKLLIVVLTIVILCLSGCDYKDYKDAEKFFMAGDYETALTYYTFLGDYSNSEELAKSCSYRLANEYFTNEEYEEALEYYTSIAGYEDSTEKIKWCNYEIANEKYENGEFKAALEIYESLGKFQNAQSLLKECKREVGMREMADYDFLEALEASILNRKETSNEEDRLTLVNTELAYLEGFRTKEFYDQKLRTLAHDYLNGLTTQKQSLNLIGVDSQIQWREGMLMRYEVLDTLYRKYDFLADNQSFIGSYISQVDNIRSEYNFLILINEDILTQTNKDDFTWILDHDNYVLTCTLTNNIPVFYDIIVEVAFHDENNVLFETHSTRVNNICPSTPYQLDIYISDPVRVDAIYTTYAFENIRYENIR